MKLINKIKLRNAMLFSCNRIINQRMLQFSALAFTAILPQGQTRVYRLPDCVPTYPSASNSVILSLAAYIAWKYPRLPHPAYPDLVLPQNNDVTVFPSQDLCQHPLYQAWCDLLCQSIYQGNVRRVANTLYISIEVKKQYADILQDLEWDKQIINEAVKIDRIFNFQQKQFQESKQRRILLLNFATSQLRQNQLLPKIHLPALIMGSMFDNEKWTSYCVLKGHYPTKEELLEASAIILPGSSNSVLDSVEPVNEFIKQFVPAFEENKKLKVLSICYGHQLVSKLFSSKVVRKSRFEGHQKVIFDVNQISKYKFLHHIAENNEDEWVMPQHHQDYVENVPEGFDLIATSQSCYVEAMVKRDARIFSLQFHPEYMSQYTNAFTTRAKIANTHYHAGFALNVPIEKLKRHHQSCELLRLCIKDFLASQSCYY